MLLKTTFLGDDYKPVDYVGTRTEPTKDVSLTVTENIVKFADGELPTEG